MWLVWVDRKNDSRYWVSINVSSANTCILLTYHRINCRLPQTPRTPSTAAAHYFDDIFSRSAKASGGKPRFRRSSTNRSIGNRSSFNTSVNGDADERESLANSAAPDGDDPEKQEANQHIANYVIDQLERVRSNESAAVYEDEFEAQLDGH